MRKVVKSIFILIIVMVCCIEMLLAEGGMVRTYNTFYDKLLNLEKKNKWKMLSEGSEQVEPAFKRYFEICSFDLQNNKKIDIELYKPENWGLKNINNYALSPDGKDIVFIIYEKDKTGAAYDTMYSLYILHTANGKIEGILPPQQFPKIGRLCYAPTGEDVFFVGKLKHIEESPSANIPKFDSLYKLNLQTKKMTELVQYSVWTINTQSCSPDGKKIVYQSSKIDEIYIYDTTTNSSSKLADGKFPTWIPTGEKIAYYGKDGNYYTINSDGSDNKIFIINKSKRNFWLFGEDVQKISGELLWSPDGRYIYYKRQAMKFMADVEHYVPYIMDISTRKEIRLPTRFDGIKSWVGQR